MKHIRKLLRIIGITAVTGMFLLLAVVVCWMLAGIQTA